MRLVDRLDMGQRAERQPETDRRIARHEEQPAAAQLPKLADPAAARLRAPMLHRQHVAGRRGEMPLEFAHDAGALGRIVDLRDRLGSMLCGSAPSLSIRSAGSSKAGSTCSVVMPSRPARPSVKRCASSVEMAVPSARAFQARSARRSARSACRRFARTARTPSAAAARRDTICPGRDAAVRPARTCRPVGGSVGRPGRAWSARTPPCSIPPPHSRRPRRRSARRPW